MKPPKQIFVKAKLLISVIQNDCVKFSLTGFRIKIKISCDQARWTLDNAVSYSDYFGLWIHHHRFCRHFICAVVVFVISRMDLHSSARFYSVVLRCCLGWSLKLHRNERLCVHLHLSASTLIRWFNTCLCFMGCANLWHVQDSKAKMSLWSLCSQLCDHQVQTPGAPSLLYRHTGVTELWPRWKCSKLNLLWDTFVFKVT